MIRRLLLVLTVACAVVSPHAHAADRIRIAVQKTGTLAWELDDHQSPRPRQEGRSRSADHRTRQHRGRQDRAARRLGRHHRCRTGCGWRASARSATHLVFYPYSSTLGAVMVPARSSDPQPSPISRARSLAVAGGPIDKSWLLLQALARSSGLDLQTASDARLWRAAALVAEGAAGRDRRDADVLEFLRGARRQGLQARGRDGRGHAEASAPKAAVAIVGYVFDEAWAAQTSRRGRAASSRSRARPRRFLRPPTPIGSGSRRASARATRATLAIYRERYARRHPAPPHRREEADARDALSRAGRDRRRRTGRSGRGARRRHVLSPDAEE